MFENFDWQIKTQHVLMESSVDFPSKTLDLDVWEPQGESYVLRSDVKALLLDQLEKYPDLRLILMCMLC